MPLKFLKKCRQYNVTSKSLFVISVHHLLDTSTTVDCTISSESKGLECLENVCQRLLIQHSEFFGLRYVVKGKEDEQRWVDLDRSLSRQLEKYAAGTKIYLRIRHYVTTGMRHLNDEVTRYYYFLQLKSDIYEGKIACDIRTAILLALYCRQAEYDCYQNDKQTKDYLKKSLVLPKNLQGLANDDTLLESLIIEVLQQNAGIQHLTQTKAEEMYIQCCQQLDGYGEERFNAKDMLGNELVLGLTVNGLVVTAENGRQYFPWRDCHTVTIDKRTIKIEQNKADVSIVGSFNFIDAETARYFWKLCITQHKFLEHLLDGSKDGVVRDLDNGNTNGSGSIGNGGAEGINSSMYGYDFSDSREDLLEQQHVIYNAGTSSGLLSAGNPEFVTAHTLQQQQQQMPHGLMASTNSSALMSSNISLAQSHQSGSGGGGGGGGGGNGALAAHGHNAHPLTPNWMAKDYAHEYASSQHLSNSILDTRVQSSSCLDLSNNNLHGSSSIINPAVHLQAIDANERERLKAMLPTYRPAPDYETAVQLKYRTPSSELHNLQTGHSGTPYQTAAYYAGSQPDVNNIGAAYVGDGAMLSHLPAHRYPDVAQPALAMHGHHFNGASMLNASSAGGANANSTNSNSNGNGNGNGNSSSSNNMNVSNTNNNNNGSGNNGGYIDLAQRLQVVRSKPPPPYPVNRLSSSSTPDLAVTSHRPLLGYHRTYVSGSSPDLVSNRNFLNCQYQYMGMGVGVGVGGVGGVVGVDGMPAMNGSGASHLVSSPPACNYISPMGHSQSYMQHGTFENLNMIEEQPSIMSQLRQSVLSQAAAQMASKNYEQHSPTTLTPLQRSHLNGSIEPIYENVPLPQYAAPQRQENLRSSGSSAHTNHTNEAMRNRTSSIQSAPGGMHAQPPIPAVRHYPPPAIVHADAELKDAPEVRPKELRAASTDLQFLEPTPMPRPAATPTPPQRAGRAASAAPAIGASHHQATDGSATNHNNNNSSLKNHHSSSSAMSVDGGVATQFAALNLSSSSSNTTAGSAMHNSTLNSSAATSTTFNSSTGTSSSKDVKRKKIWNILSRSKTPDKQKSATLGRDKASAAASKSNKASKTAQDDLHLPYRWSTGVSKLHTISGQHSKDELCQILDNKLNDSQLYMEFERIPKRREMARYDCALLEENAMKNSDPNFLPYDDNRVRITPSMGNRHGYVNASHISATVGTKQRFYIVAQSPHDDPTTHIFWQCIWEADVYLVVQLSDDSSYVPQSTNQRLEFGQFQVYQEFSQTTDRCITSKLRLYHVQSRRYRSVWHLNYTDWVEQNCPRDVNHFLDFLEELNSVRMASINEVPPGHNTNPPVLIHCLEGSGRSGVTLTADLLLYTLDHNEDLDIPRVISQLRHQRDSIIPSLAQYKFIYRLLINYLKRTRLI